MATQPDRSYFFSGPAAQPTSRCIAGRHNVALRQQFECHPWRSCDVSKGQLTRRSNTLRVAPGRLAYDEHRRNATGETKDRLQTSFIHSHELTGLTALTSVGSLLQPPLQRFHSIIIGSIPGGRFDAGLPYAVF